MNALTKAWLQKQITDLEATRDEIPFGLDEDGNNTLAALKMAHAGMEAEPVAWLWSNRKHSSEVKLVRPEDDERAESAQWSGWSCQALYSVPQTASSVPDEMPDSVYEILCQACGGGEKACDFADELWNACRAAMLQGVKS